MKKPTKPTKDEKSQKNEQKRPSREEEKDYFRKAAELDIAAEDLFSKSSALSLPHLSNI